MEQDKALQSVLRDLTECAGYSRLPPRLAQLYPQVIQADDVHGVVARLNAMKTVLANDNLGSIIDIGGNSGYFCLSLIDSGRAESATVYDVMPHTLAAGRKMAQLLNIADKIEYIERRIDLDFVRDLPKSDTFICLNLMHHAGLLFDQELVRREGWAAYIQEFLRVIRTKSRIAIVGMAFDRSSPINWNIQVSSAAQVFQKYVEDAGWRVRYYANVRELERLGVDGAKNKFVTRPDGMADKSLKTGIKIVNSALLRPLKEIVKKALRKKEVLSKVQNLTGSMKYYHLYILDAR